MTTSWYIYAMALLVAAPVFAILAVFGFTLVRELLRWVMGEEAKQPSGPKVTLKG